MYLSRLLRPLDSRMSGSSLRVTLAQGTRRTQMSAHDTDDNRGSMFAVYAQVGDNYRAIDDLRLRLLALLPLATGTGILVLLGGHSVSAAVGVPVGVFGMIATISLYFYELHGVEKCAHYIARGAQLEQDLDVPGSFTNRPHHIFGVVSELLPSALIYPASFAGWLFLALYHAGPAVRGLGTVAVFVAGAGASMATIFVMEKTRPRRHARLERNSPHEWHERSVETAEAG